jgi:hypothetical protein
MVKNISVPWAKPRILAVGLGAAWLGIILTGTFMMLSYANSPGPAGSLPGNWPEASGVRHDPEQPTLVMFLHPHCPCSRASVGELALLMAHCQGRVATHVFFLQPAETDSNWALTDLWRETQRIPGVTVHRDNAGREARLFGAQTSGEIALYDAKGQLIFHGGITISRGHSGDNPGRDALQALLIGNPAQLANTPVFGCSLFECKLAGHP